METNGGDGDGDPISGSRIGSGQIQSIVFGYQFVVLSLFLAVAGLFVARRRKR